MPIEHKSSIISIGHCAFQTLCSDKEAVVLGITSKGVFAVTSDKNVLFFSGEPFCGPLTANLQDYDQIKQKISIKSHLVLSSGMIRFEGAQLELDIHPSTTVWKPPAFSSAATSRSALLERAHEFYKWMDLDAIDETINLSSHLLDDLYEHIRTGKYEHIADTLVSVIGRGAGLTPTGDDFICGFLLAAYHWRERFFPHFPFEQIKSRLSEAAIQLTTTLSMNLINCAAQGSADMRILAALHWLNDGNGNLNTIIKELRTYGSSSGFDTLHGILAVIRAALAMGS